MKFLLKRKNRNLVVVITADENGNYKEQPGENWTTNRLNIIGEMAGPIDAGKAVEVRLPNATGIRDLMSAIRNRSIQTTSWTVVQ